MRIAGLARSASFHGVVIALLLAAGCRSWQPVSPGEPLPDRIRVAIGGDTLVLRQPRIDGDSVLVGTIESPGAADTARVPLSDVGTLEAHAKDNLKTFLFVWVAAGMGLGLLLGGA